MDVNNYKIQRTVGLDNELVVPIELSWDYQGIDQSIDIYQDEMITEVIGVGRDFEVSRFANAPYTAGTQTNKTEINYNFYFHSGTSISTPSS